MNMSKFRNIELEFAYIPDRDSDVQFYQIYDPTTGLAVGVNKPIWNYLSIRMICMSMRNAIIW